MCRAVVFALGLASTLALLGVVSTYVGRAYGQIGSGLPIGALRHVYDLSMSSCLWMHISLHLRNYISGARHCVCASTFMMT